MGKEKTTRIVLFDGYEILRDSLCYSLVINTGRKTKEGNISYKYLSYHGSMEQALIAAKKDYTKKIIMSHDVLTLDDAVSVIVRANNRFEALVKRSFEGVTT